MVKEYGREKEVCDGLVLCERSAFLEVCARAERLIHGTCEDQDSRRAILRFIAYSIDLVTQLGEQLLAYCIASLWSIQGEDLDGPDVWCREVSGLDHGGWSRIVSEEAILPQLTADEESENLG